MIMQTLNHSRTVNKLQNLFSLLLTPDFPHCCRRLVLQEGELCAHQLQRLLHQISCSKCEMKMSNVIIPCSPDFPYMISWNPTSHFTQYMLCYISVQLYPLPLCECNPMAHIGLAQCACIGPTPRAPTGERQLARAHTISATALGLMLALPSWLKGIDGTCFICFNCVLDSWVHGGSNLEGVFLGQLSFLKLTLLCPFELQ